MAGMRLHPPGRPLPSPGGGGGGPGVSLGTGWWGPLCASPPFPLLVVAQLSREGMLQLFSFFKRQNYKNK